MRRRGLHRLRFGAARRHLAEVALRGGPRRRRHHRVRGVRRGTRCHRPCLGGDGRHPRSLPRGTGIGGVADRDAHAERGRAGRAGRLTGDLPPGRLDRRGLLRRGLPGHHRQPADQPDRADRRRCSRARPAGHLVGRPSRRPGDGARPAPPRRQAGTGRPGHGAEPRARRRSRGARGHGGGARPGGGMDRRRPGGDGRPAHASRAGGRDLPDRRVPASGIRRADAAGRSRCAGRGARATGRGPGRSCSPPTRAESSTWAFPQTATGQTPGRRRPSHLHLPDPSLRPPDRGGDPRPGTGQGGRRKGGHLDRLPTARSRLRQGGRAVRRRLGGEAPSLPLPDVHPGRLHRRRSPRAGLGAPGRRPVAPLRPRHVLPGTHRLRGDARGAPRRAAPALRRASVRLRPLHPQRRSEAQRRVVPRPRPSRRRPRSRHHQPLTGRAGEPDPRREGRRHGR